MARAELEQPTDIVVTDAIDLLTRDHRLVDELFASLLQAAPQQLDPLARRLCKMVRIHTQIEEELFYPTARRALGNEDVLIDEAEHDHTEAKQTVMRLESMTSEDSEFVATVAALKDQIAAHVASEESELFPRVRRSKVDLISLGITLTERRDTLMDVLGLHGDDEEGAVNMRELLRPATAKTLGTTAKS